jgi:hypothetical protein
MESKELARLKDIDTRLKGIEDLLRRQNKILKEQVDQIMKIADIFDKQWHGDANGTSNGDFITVPAIDKIVARRICGMDISGIVEEAEKGDTNETEE